MKDEDAWLALGAGSPEERARAREVLAERYYPALVLFLERTLGFRPEAALTGAGDAVMELLNKLELNPDAISPDEGGFWRWLLRAGTYRARDARRWIRRREAAGTVESTHNPGTTVDRAPAESPELFDSQPSPPEAAGDREVASRVLSAILTLRPPGRSILLYDFAGAYELLTGEEMETHDEDLIDATKPFGIWTTDALRSHRRRAMKQLREILGRELR